MNKRNGVVNMRFLYVRYILGAVCTLLAVVPNSYAATLGPVDPPPGGYTFSSSGSGTLGTKTDNYSSFNASAFGSLYFGLNQVSYGTLGAGLDGNLAPFVLSGTSGTTATWTGSTTWYNDVTLVATAATTRLTMTVTGLGANPWITNLASVGLDNIGTFGDLGAVADNSSGVDFSLLWSIEADVGSGFVPINTVSQHPNNQGDSVSSFAAEFYYTAVPVPAAVWLFGSALGLLGWMRKRQPA